MNTAEGVRQMRCGSTKNPAASRPSISGSPEIGTKNAKAGQARLSRALRRIAFRHLATISEERKNKMQTAQAATRAEELSWRPKARSPLMPSRGQPAELPCACASSSCAWPTRSCWSNASAAPGRSQQAVAAAPRGRLSGRPALTGCTSNRRSHGPSAARGTRSTAWRGRSLAACWHRPRPRIGSPSRRWMHISWIP